MSRLGLTFDCIWSSPLVRALETAEIARDGTGSPCAIETTEQLRPEASHTGVLDALSRKRRSSSASRVLLVGHQPLLGTVFAALAGVKPAGGLCVGKGTLIWLEMEDARRGGAILKRHLALDHLIAIAHGQETP